MKVILCIVLFVAAAATVFSQNALEYNASRSRITRNGMLVLGSWGAANMIVGGIGLATSSGQTKYFHQMNLIWGGANLLVAASGFIGSKRKSDKLSLSQTIKGQAAMEKTFLFNAGLDLVYLTAGLYCREKSKNQRDPSQYRGYGNSLFLQGGGLLIFDAIMYITHATHARQLYKLLNGVEFSGTSAGVSWKF